MRRALPSLPLLCLLLLVPAGAACAAPTLAERVARIGRDTVVRLLAVAGAAQRAKDVRTARSAYERILELDPEHAAARRELGWRKGPQGWSRDKPPAPLGPSAEEDATLRERRAQAEAELAKIESERADLVLKACLQAGEREAARPFLLDLLRRTPKLVAVHEALGHEQVGQRWARPELVGLARREDESIAAWAACREPGVPAEATTEVERVPGLSDLKYLRVGKRLVSTSLSGELVQRLATQSEAPHRLLALLLGSGVQRFDPAKLLFLEPPAYEALIKGRHPEEDDARRRLRAGNYVAPGLLALRVTPLNASDMYAHNVGYFSAQAQSAPTIPEDRERRNFEVYAWWCEGLGYLMSLELWDSAYTSFYSNAESNAKVKDALAPPTVRTAPSLIGWVRELLLRGEAYGLREVVGKSLNSLDFMASIQAYTLVRFLALQDPEAFRGLPAALRAQEHGGEPERVEQALLATYKVGLETLEPLWRLWLLELH